MKNFDDALAIINAIKDNVKNERVWVIQRLIGVRPNGQCLSGFEETYETLAEFRPMSYDEIWDAQREARKKYSNARFRAHSLKPGSKG
jgi:hypothetical protein